MEIAVAGVKNVRDPEAVLGADLADARQRVRQLAERNDAVHAEIIGNTADGAERGFAPGPNARALIGVRADRHGFRIEPRSDFRDAAEQNADFVLRAFDLDNQQGFSVERISGAGERLADFGRGAIHVFDGNGNDAGRNDRCDAAARSLGRPEADQHRPRGFGGRMILTVASVMTPS